MSRASTAPCRAESRTSGRRAAPGAACPRQAAFPNRFVLPGQRDGHGGVGRHVAGWPRTAARCRTGPCGPCARTPADRTCRRGAGHRAALPPKRCRHSGQDRRQPAASTAVGRPMAGRGCWPARCAVGRQGGGPGAPARSARPQPAAGSRRRSMSAAPCRRAACLAASLAGRRAVMPTALPRPVAREACCRARSPSRGGGKRDPAAAGRQVPPAAGPAMAGRTRPGRLAPFFAADGALSTAARRHATAFAQPRWWTWCSRTHPAAFRQSHGIRQQAMPEPQPVFAKAGYPCSRPVRGTNRLPTIALRSRIGGRSPSARGPRAGGAARPAATVHHKPWGSFPWSARRSAPARSTGSVMALEAAMVRRQPGPAVVLVPGPDRRAAGRARSRRGGGCRATARLGSCLARTSGYRPPAASCSRRGGGRQVAARSGSALARPSGCCPAAARLAASRARRRGGLGGAVHVVGGRAGVRPGGCRSAGREAGPVGRLIQPGVPACAVGPQASGSRRRSCIPSRPPAAACTSAGKSSNSCTWRSSIRSPSAAGQRAAQASASALEAVRIIQ